MMKNVRVLLRFLKLVHKYIGVVIQYMIYDFWWTRVGSLLYKAFWMLMHLLSPLPVIVVVVSVGYSYKYCVEDVAFGVYQGNLFAQVLYLSVGNLLTVIVASCYFRCMFSRSPPVPHQYILPRDIVNAIGSASTYEDQQTILKAFAERRGLQVEERDLFGGIRICSTCLVVKPDRCHHCRKCAQCIQVFDHHCPWIANCVHSRNRKLFILLLFYTHIYCLFSFVTSYSLCAPFYKAFLGVRFDDEEGGQWTARVSTIAVTQMAFGFGSTVMFVFHIFLVFTNLTTFELGMCWFQWRKGCHYQNPHNLGWRRNFMQIFGTNKWLWLVPTLRKGDPAYLLTKLKPSLCKLV